MGSLWGVHKRGVTFKRISQTAKEHKSESREPAIIQLGQQSTVRKSSISVTILKVEKTKLANGLDVYCKRDSTEPDTKEVLAWLIGRMELPFALKGKAKEEQIWA